MTTRVVTTLALAAVLASPASLASETIDVDGIPVNPLAPRPGLECGDWTLEKYGNAGTATALRCGARTVLKLECRGGSEQRAAFKFVPGIKRPTSGIITFDVYCSTDRPPKIAFALGLTRDYKWAETEPREIRGGWNRVECPLDRPIWRRDGKPGATVDADEDIRHLVIMIHNGRRSGHLLFEGIAPVDEPPSGQAKTLDRPEDWAEGVNRISSLGAGFLVWESNRSGSWRIWRRDLDGSGCRQFSPDDKKRNHHCPHISPDGRRLVYLSYHERTSPYDKHSVWTPAVLHCMDSGGGDRILKIGARSYWGGRAAVWIDEDEIAYIAADGSTRRLNVDTLTEAHLFGPSGDGYGWLIDPTLKYATDGHPRFSAYDSPKHSIALGKKIEGCQPYFTSDGIWGYWVYGAGGPIKRIELATLTASVMLARFDDRLPPGRGYLYFPMISRCRRLLAFGASSGAHDHSSADYAIFVAQLAPTTLEIVGDPVRYTFCNRTDRYPDVWLSGNADGLPEDAADVEHPLRERDEEGDEPRRSR